MGGEDLAQKPEVISGFCNLFTNELYTTYCRIEMLCGANVATGVDIKISRNAFLDRKENHKNHLLNHNPTRVFMPLHYGELPSQLLLRCTGG